MLNSEEIKPVTLAILSYASLKAPDSQQKILFDKIFKNFISTYCNSLELIRRHYGGGVGGGSMLICYHKVNI